MIRQAVKKGKKQGITLIFALLGMGLYGQDFQDSTALDSARRVMDTEEGINYTPTYYYYIHSLIPTTPKRLFADTSVFNFHNQDVSLHSRNLYANLGMFGHAQFSMNFAFERIHGFTYKTLPFSSYLRTIENWKMYHPDKVYTYLEWDFINGSGEHHFSAEHAQKITDDLNFGLSLETVYAKGRYVRQGVRNINLGATFDYLMPSHRYGFQAFYICNFMDLNENGGIAHDSLFEKDTLNNPLNRNVLFSNANNRIFQNTFFFRHFIALSGKDTLGMAKKGIGFLVHDIQLNTSKNLFLDANLDSSAYSDFYFSRDTTSDLTKNYLLRNSLMWTNYLPNDTMPTKANYLHIAAGILYDFISVKDTGILISGDTLKIFVNQLSKPFRNNQLTPFGRVHTQLFRYFFVDASLFFTLNGYNAGDLTLNGKLGVNLKDKKEQNHEITFNLGLYNYSPDYFLTHLTANNYFWRNEDLKKQQTLFLGAEWVHKGYHLGLNYYSLHNYTFLNDNSLPEQLDGFATIYQLTAYIPFHYKGFGFNTNVYIQYASDIVRIPIVAGRQSVYYGFSLFKKALYLQSGFDFLYNTAYYANAYNPALQQFQQQNTKKIGNYGYLDFYLRAKINRFVVSAKLTHFWAGLFGKKYYLVPHYPARDLGFTVSIGWRFYD